MRLQLILPQVEPTEYKRPRVCPHKGCQGRYFEHHQEVDKPLKDTIYGAVITHRYRCLRCQRTFRVYPQGVTHAQTSQRVKGLGVLLYLLGLSYGAVSLALEALGVYLSKSSVYEAVQAAAEKVPGLKRDEVFAGLWTPALGGDLTSVKWNGHWLHLGLAMDDTTGLVLTVDELSAEDAETLKEWLEPIAEAVGAELLVSDDADAFKTAADELDLLHQVCKSHVKNNTEVLIDTLGTLAGSDKDGSLAEIGVTAEQAQQDLTRTVYLVSLNGTLHHVRRDRACDSGGTPAHPCPPIARVRDCLVPGSRKPVTGQHDCTAGLRQGWEQERPRIVTPVPPPGNRKAAGHNHSAAYLVFDGVGCSEEACIPAQQLRTSQKEPAARPSCSIPRCGSSR